MSEQNTEFAYLDTYNAKYNNDVYRALSRAAADALHINPDFTMIRTVAHQQHNSFMLACQDAAFELCGSTKHENAGTMPGLAACGLDFLSEKPNSATVRLAYQKWLNLFA
jgi:hypothetical protein